MRALRRTERWLWTGPVGHLVGVGLDFAPALARYLLARPKRRVGERRARGARLHKQP